MAAPDDGRPHSPNVFARGAHLLLELWHSPDDELGSRDLGLYVFKDTPLAFGLLGKKAEQLYDHKPDINGLFDLVEGSGPSEAWPIEPA
jgi:hypothetical protein